MPSKIAKNSFQQGMNKDVSPLFLNNTAYADANNFRLSVNEDASLGTLENVKGNELLLSASANLDHTDDKIVRHVVIEDKLILFTHRITDSVDTNISKIQAVTFNDDALDTVTLLWSDYGKADEDKLNITTSSIIKAVSRKEATDIEKIYWVDNDNYLRFANVYTYLTTDGLIKSVNNSYVSAKSFGTVASVVFDEPSITSSGGGGLNVGMVQYAYQLYNKNGSETSFSPATGLFHLTSSADSGADSKDYRGNAVEDESGKSFTLLIELSNYDYDSIRIVSIHYEYYQQLPTINIITEKSIPSSGNVSFTDRGTGYVGSYTVEEFTTIAGLYKAKDIASSKNYLFMANVTENYFDIGDYDARSYRFKKESYETTTNITYTDIALSPLVDDSDPDISGNIATFRWPSDPAAFGQPEVIPGSPEPVDSFALGATSKITVVWDDLSEYVSDAASALQITDTVTAGSEYKIVLAVTDGYGYPGGGALPTSMTLTHVTTTYTRRETTTITSTIARTYEGDGYTYVIEPNGDWTYKTSGGVTVTSGTDWTLPETANLLNYYNDTTNDAAALYNFDLQLDGVTKGGSGLNIDYEIKVDTQIIDDNTYPYTLKTDDTGGTYSDVSNTVGWQGARSPILSAYGKSYQRQETYRFGIVFFDKFGRQSVVKWIGDIRMPNMTWKTIVELVGNDIVSYSIYPKFTVNNYPDDAVAFKIVRVERDSDNKSVVMTGLVRPTGVYGDEGARQPFHNGTSAGQIDLQEFISPEISFYKDFSPINSDYIAIEEFGNKLMYDLGNKVEKDISTVVDDFSLKCRKVSPYYIYATTTITDGKVVLPGESGETTNIGGITFRPYYDQQGGDQEGYKGTSLIFASTDQGWSYTGGSLTGKTPAQATMWGSYRRHIYDAQYGGTDYAARVANEYISASALYVIPEALTAKASYANQGDVFIGFMDQLAMYWNESMTDGVTMALLFPVEASINIDLRHDDSFTRVYNNSNTDYRRMSEYGNADYDYSELYLYNTVYSQENNTKLYYPQPADEDPVTEQTFNTRIIVSEKKFNGEESDSWLSFLTNNFIDVDANQGELNNIKDYNNNLLFWQPRAVGMVDVDPRSLITDDDSSSLVLGTGAVLSRFDYLSKLTGNSNDYGLVTTPRGIYWHDSITNTLVRYDGKTIERLSKTKNAQSFMNNNKFENGLLTYHEKYDEVLYSLSSGTGNDATLVFNERAGVFTGFYSFNPILYININNRLISTDDRSDLWIHDTSTSDYGIWYAATAVDSTVKLIINEGPDVVKVFDNINYSLYAYNADDILQYNSNFESIRCYNSFQNTDTIVLTSTNSNRKKGMWSYQIPRNAVNASPDTEPDIFDASNLDTTLTFKERIRDTYMITDITLSNTSNDRVQIPFINTKYRFNFR